jgi:hypothetical protein
MIKSTRIAMPDETEMISIEKVCRNTHKQYKCAYKCAYKRINFDRDETTY